MDATFAAVKDEPIEEFFVSEKNYQLTTVRNETEACCLCAEGKKLQLMLYQHIRDAHHFDSNMM